MHREGGGGGRLSTKNVMSPLSPIYIYIYTIGFHQQEMSRGIIRIRMPRGKSWMTDYANERNLYP